MSRMVRSAFPGLPGLPGLMQLSLCILVACLAVHFIVEDTRLASIFAPPDLAAQGTHPADNTEFDHLDDLAFPVSIPEQVSESMFPHGFFWTVLVEKPANFPIPIPPKI
jgi:hypothetical protein